MPISKGVLYHIMPKVKDKKGWTDKESNNPPDCVYEGDIKNGMPHGKGIYTKTDGSKYVGYFKNGLRHGQGTFTWPENTPKGAGKYVGEYKENIRWNGVIIDKKGEFVYKYVNGELINSSSHKASLEIY